MQMRSISIAAFTASPDTYHVVSEALARTNWRHEVHEGGMNAAMSVASTWSSVPDVLILDVSTELDPEQALKEFAGSAPPGQTHLIAIGEGDDVKTYKRFRDMGALEYISAPVDSEEIDKAIKAIAGIIAGRADSIDPAKILLVTSARGGAGGSTLTAEIALAVSAQHEKRTLLVDLDLEYGCQHSLLGVEPSKGLEAMLHDVSRIDTLMLNRTVIRGADKNLAILSDNIQDAAGKFPAKTGAGLVNAVANDLDAVIVDLPARSPFFKDLVAIAGTIVIVSPPSFHGLRDTMALLGSIEKAGGHKKAIIAVSKDGEVKAGAVSLATFQDKLGKGSRAEFRSTMEFVSVPYAPKAAFVAANRGEAMLGNQTPIGKSLMKLVSLLPTAPARTTKSGFFGRLFGA